MIEVNMTNSVYIPSVTIHLLHCRFKSTVKSVNFTPNSLFLGLHETHLQFIVWKEMLGSIKPGEDISYM